MRLASTSVTPISRHATGVRHHSTRSDLSTICPPRSVASSTRIRSAVSSDWVLSSAYTEGYPLVNNMGWVSTWTPLPMPQTPGNLTARDGALGQGRLGLDPPRRTRRKPALPTWADRYALTRFTLSGPRTAAWFDGYNQHQPRDAWIRPGSFGLIAYPATGYHNRAPPPPRTNPPPATGRPPCGTTAPPATQSASRRCPIRPPSIMARASGALLDSRVGGLTRATLRLR
jgi:hypothetical protein